MAKRDVWRLSCNFNVLLFLEVNFASVQLPPPPNILQNQKIQEYQKQRHINQCIEIRLRYAHSSVNIGNHIYTNVQNCILLK